MSGPKYTEADYENVMAMPAERYSLRDVWLATGVSMSTVKRMRDGTWQPPSGPSTPLLGRSPLTGVIEEQVDQGWTLDELTVLARDNDPFRQDRAEGHRLGQWLRDTLEAMGFEIGEGGRTIHNRGVHYTLIGQRKPDGSAYENDERTWKWLSDRVSKAARWLGYVPFTQITDQRNAEPVIREVPAAAGERILPGYGSGDLALDAEYFAPAAHLEGGGGIQAYRLAIIGEKSSLEPVLGPVAAEYGADLYLPTGEISDTILHQMATRTAAEQRPLVVFYFADCDPSGWQMGISVSRKLQALSELLGGFEFEVHRVALTPDQVRELRLPSTPLKRTEKRAGKWEARTGTKQTEIDAAIALRPAELGQIAREALAPFFDATLASRFEQARQDWEDEAQEVIDGGMDGDRDDLLAAARVKLDQVRTLIDEVSESLRSSAGPGDLEEFEPPEPEAPIGDALPSGLGTTLVTSEWSYPEQCQALKQSKAYGGDEAEDEDEAPEES
jgi:hypothetical protein